MKTLQYLHPRRSRMKMPEEKEHKDEDSWSQVEQIAKISAQFAAALAVIGGLIGVVILSASSSFAFGFREAARISSERFLNLPSPRFEYKLFGGLNFLTVFITTGVAFCAGGLVWWIVLEGIRFLLRKEKLIFLLSVGILLCFIIENSLRRPEGTRWWGLLNPLVVTITFWVFRRAFHDNNKKVVLLKGYRKLESRIIKIVVIFSLPLVVLFSFMFLFNLFVASAETTAYISQSIGWARGAQEVCRSPQVVFDRGGDELSGQTTFLLMRTDTEYYIFTTTITTTLPPPPTNIKQFVQPFQPLLPRTEGCSPANIITFSVTDVGTVKLVYDEQVKPGNCCYQLFGPTPTPIPAPTPSATPDP